MPFGDGTGPRGMGPMTDRVVGCSTGSGRPGFANPATARRWFSPGWIGRGLQSGRGRGWHSVNAFSVPVKGTLLKRRHK